MIRALLGAGILVGLSTVANAETQQNFDFMKSPCATRVTAFENGVAVRVFPHLAGQSEFYLMDGKTDWKKTFGRIDTYTAFDYVARGTFDGWAIYQMHHEGGPSDGFKVQYMLGKITAPEHDCKVVPEAPEDVSISEMPPLAVQMYVRKLTGDGSGQPDELRDRLRKAMSARPKVIEGDSSTPSREVVSGKKPTPDVSGLTEVCGRPVGGVLVEEGKHEPFPVLDKPDISGDEDIGYQEWSHLLSSGGKVTVHCFEHDGDANSFEDVELPKGTSRCVLSDSRMMCGIASAEDAGTTERSLEPNMDFSKSPCKPLGDKLGEYVNTRMYPVFKDGTLDRFEANDGSNWMKTFFEMPKDMREEVGRVAGQDPWAFYRVVRENGIFKGFSAVYGFGDLSAGTCMVDDESSKVIDTFDIPEVTAKAFLQGYGGDTSGHPGDWRPRLDALLKQQKTEPKTSSPLPDGRPAIENACGIRVQNALVEIGDHKPPKIFTPENANGRIEFNYLSEADEPLRAMCFSDSDEKSLYREPLPSGLERCVLADQKMACWGKPGLQEQMSGDDHDKETSDSLALVLGDPDKVPRDSFTRRVMKERINAVADEIAKTDPYTQALFDNPKVPSVPLDEERPSHIGLRPDVDDLPVAVAQEFVNWDSYCLHQENNATGSFDSDYLTIVDIDMDGHKEFILNNDGASCVLNGKEVAHGGGNGGTTLRVISNDRKVLDVFTQGAEIFAYKGYAVAETGRGIFQIAQSKSTRIKKRPKGGKSVYTLAR